MEPLHQPPTPASYTPLAQHQSQTPESFYSGPPVLHHHCPSTSLFFHASDLAAAPSALAGLASGARGTGNGRVNGEAAVGAAVNGDSVVEHREGGDEEGEGEGDEGDEEEDEEELEIAGVDVWVTSERLILYSRALSTGLSIPYPSISLHALQRPSSSSSSSSHGKPASLFLQLLTEAQTFDDHDPDATISLTVVPRLSSRAEGAAEDEERDEGVGGGEEAQRIYAALSACANLHPDPMSGSEVDQEDYNDDEEDARGGGQRPAIMFAGDQDVAGVYPLSSGRESSGLPPPMPGSGGWITAENVGEFFDEEGNWRGDGGGGLGQGAGTVRMREEEDGGGGEDVDADGDGEGGGGTEETKWRRTE